MKISIRYPHEILRESRSFNIKCFKSHLNKSALSFLPVRVDNNSFCRNIESSFKNKRALNESKSLLRTIFLHRFRGFYDKEIRLPSFVVRGILDESVIPVRGNRAWNLDRFDSGLAHRLRRVSRNSACFSRKTRDKDTRGLPLLYLRA